MKTITILSGKGGVGKSSFTASLAIVLSKKYKIVAADCDVDAPNLGLLFGIRNLKRKEKISTNYKAFITKEVKKCLNAKKLPGICTFSAISWDDKRNMPVINKFLCEGCGTCKLLCPEIKLRKVKNAVVGEVKTKYGFYLVSGQLKIGESGSGNVVEVVKERARSIAKKVKADFIVLDSSAGIGCPVIASIRESDFVVGITEPTPSGLSDLKRAFDVVNHFGIKHGIVINKYDLNKRVTKQIERFAKVSRIPILGKLPYDRKFVQALVDMVPIVVYDRKYEKAFLQILRNICESHLS